MRYGDADRAVAALAASQHGAFRDDQAAALGITPNMQKARRRSGLWLRPVEGVNVLAGSPRTWDQRLLVAVLAAAPVAAASHRAATTLRGLDGLHRSALEISVSGHHRRPHIAGLVVHRVRDLEPIDLDQVAGIPCTGVARTLADLGSVVGADIVERAVDDAVRRRLTTLGRLHWTAERLHRPGQRGTGTLLRLLARRQRGERVPDSFFERLVERLLTHAGVPAPVRQFVVTDDDDTELARLDLAWPDLRIGVEAESATWHTGPRANRRDLRRRNRVEAAGWHVFHAVWDEVTDQEAAAELVAVVRRALDRSENVAPPAAIRTPTRQLLGARRA